MFREKNVGYLVLYTRNGCVKWNGTVVFGKTIMEFFKDIYLLIYAFYIYIILVIFMLYGIPYSTFTICEIVTKYSTMVSVK